MYAHPDQDRAEDLRRWRSDFSEATPIAELQARQPATCVGVVHKVRLVPGVSVEITIEDGSGRIAGLWSGRSSLPGVELGGAMSLTGTVAQDGEGTLRMRNPSWQLVREPYA